MAQSFVRYLTVQECKQVGGNPYAIYGGNVYSFTMSVNKPSGEQDTVMVAYGSEAYAQAVAKVDSRSSVCNQKNQN